MFRHRGFYHHGGFGWGWVGMTIGLIILFLLLAAVVLLLVRLYRGPHHHPATASHWGAAATPPPASPQQLLADRFARGEIDAEEYRHRLGVLQNPSAPPEQPPPGS